uniref:Uncharacterized protein n=1 Tax=Caenorhabditis japonica TaxID=281687 RepID=A0A8R1EDG4_CAEJA
MKNETIQFSTDDVIEEQFRKWPSLLFKKKKSKHIVNASSSSSYFYQKNDEDGPSTVIQKWKSKAKQSNEQ